MWRLFIAIELPQSVITRLSELQADLKRETPPDTVRWVNPTGIHLTLKFLGDTPVTQRAVIEAALAQAASGHAPFMLAAGGLGCFPNCRRPRVVWAGIRESLDALAALQWAVEQFVAPLGYPTEDRPFSPHLTLGRIQRDARPGDVQKLGERVVGTPSTEPERWQVERITLIRSELKPAGAVYTPLFHAALG
jgi:2'-5' RNA ligase